MRPLVTLVSGGLLAASAVTAMPAEEITVVEVKPAFETANLPDSAQEANADDPAIYVDPADPTRSLVLAAVKDGGIRVYDLAGRTIQAVDPPRAEDGRGRINNIDVAYGFRLDDGTLADIAVASDRGLDVIRIYRIEPGAVAPLTEITDPGAARAFPTRAGTGGSEEDNPLPDQNTVYGIALWHDRRTGTVTVVGTQRDRPRVGIFRLLPVAGGRVRAELVAVHDFPDEHDGQDLFAEEDDDPLRSFSPQFEGVVVDQETGFAYLGQEDVGIWWADLRSPKPRRELIYATRGSPASPFHNPDSVVARDVEGLTIYYGNEGEKYLITSSQGGAHGDEPAPDPPYDDSFVVFDIAGEAIRLVGSFRIVADAERGIDAVQESDGADVISTALPGWPNGLFVAQDGYNDDLDGLSGETEATNFKFVDWRAIADRFEPKLAVSPEAWDPRR
jgi:myo-inositol-hexaphosphate 3-phosphohydrolase